MFPGFFGVAFASAAFLLILAVSYWKNDAAAFNYDPKGREGAFEPFMARYLRLSEFIIGLATGSIVLLTGSSFLHGHAGHLPWFYASPLILLGCSVVYGVFFMVWLIFSYEHYSHGNPHTRIAYSLSETLGFSSLACFAAGYFSLVFMVTR